MNIVTIGLSPFVLASRAKVHSLIIKYLYLTGHSVASLAWGHSESYFIPEEDENGKKFYFDFDYNDSRHKIPLFPFNRGGQESIQVYEFLKSLSPDLVVCIGDLSDMSYMHAIKLLYPGTLKWVGVLLHYNDPVTQSNEQVLHDMNAIMCTSEFGHNRVQEIDKNLHAEICHVGPNPNIYNFKERETSDICQIMACPKIFQSDCAPTIMRAVCEMSRGTPSHLYMHTNIYDDGDHDLQSLRLKFDPQETVVTFPEKYVSILDGITETEMSQKYSEADIFVSIPMITGSAMSVFQAIASGCFPILSDGGTNREITTKLSEFLGDDFSKDDFLVPTIQVFSAGDHELNICGHSDLRTKIESAWKKLKKYKGLRKQLSEFAMNNTQGEFLKKFSKMCMAVMASENSLRLETINGDN